MPWARERATAFGKRVVVMTQGFGLQEQCRYCRILHGRVSAVGPHSVNLRDVATSRNRKNANGPAGTVKSSRDHDRRFAIRILASLPRTRLPMPSLVHAPKASMVITGFSYSPTMLTRTTIRCRPRCRAVGEPAIFKRPTPSPDPRMRLQRATPRSTAPSTTNPR